MKRIQLFFILSFFVCMSGFAQDMEKRNYENGRDIGGDVAIKSSNVKVENGEIYKTFEVESLGECAYYLDAWIIAPFTKDGYSEYKVAVNGVQSGFSLKSQTDGWHSLALTDAKKSSATINLKKGLNKISVIGKGPEVPNIEFIKLSSNLSRTGISDSKYREFVESLKSNNLNETYNDYSQQVSSNRGTSGEIYDYYLNMPVFYTTYYSYIFNAGQVVTILTNPSLTNPAINYNIELFSKFNSQTYSWHSSNISGLGSLTVTIPVKGSYRLCIRTNSQPTLFNSSGLVDISVNNLLYVNCIVSNSIYAPVTSNYPTPANFFTCKIKNSGDTWLMLENNLEEIRDYNGDFIVFLSDGYSWGNASRITTDLTDISLGHVFSESSYNPFFECDLYMGLAASNNALLNTFPNLPADNSFYSDHDYNYNCVSWSLWKDAANYWPSTYELTTWDAFYEHYGYIRDDINIADAAIALWKRYDNTFLLPDGSVYYEFTHVSIRKNLLNQYPHGFDWESKCGRYLPRVMHTRDALNGYTYGSIAHYYRPDPTRTVIYRVSDDESSFSTSDLNQISLLIKQIPTYIISNFEKKYFAWEETWRKSEISIHSNPYMYAKSFEYEKLVKYCVQYGKAIWPLLIDKLSTGETLIVNLLKDLTYNRGTPDFIDYIRMMSSDKMPFLYSNLVDYCKKLLANEEENILNTIRNLFYNEENNFKVNIGINGNEILINLKLLKDEKTLVSLYNVFGGLELEESNKISKGDKTLKINASNLKKGIYIVKITINSESTSQTISI